MKRKILLLAIAILCNIFTYAQKGVSISNTGADPDKSAMLDVSATAKGVLIPRMTEAQRIAIADSVAPGTVANGLLVYQTDGTAGFYYFDGLSWSRLRTGSLDNFTESNYLFDTRTGVKLQAWNAADDVDFVISSKGTGAILAQQPDGTVTGGNKRGLRAVDLQMNRDSIFQVAGGESAVITGGRGNTASGSFSFIGGGLGNIAPSYGETVLGIFATTYTPSDSLSAVPTDRLFSIGNGTSVSRSNALTILKNGYTTIGGNLTINANGFGGGYTFPDVWGLPGQFLRTNGDGMTTWASLTKSDVGLGNVENTALSTWAGSSNLTTLGTITTGTWNGTTIAIANGGTGATTKSAAFDALSPMTTQGDMIYGGTAGTGARLVKGTAGQVLKMNAGETAPEWSSQALAYFTESRWTADPNSSRYVYQLAPAGTVSENADLALTPLGTGAFLANVPDGSTAGGNKRGQYAVDLQLRRSLSFQVASGDYAVIAGGTYNMASGNGSTVGGGVYNLASGLYSTVAGGRIGTASGSYSFVGGGFANVALGACSFLGGGYSNTAGSYVESVFGSFATEAAGNTTGFDPADRLFVVGNGALETARSNALTILKNANTTIGGTLEINKNGTNTSYSFPAGRGTGGQLLQTDGSGASNWANLAKGDVGLGNVENTALSTWAGSSNLTTLGTITTGTWNGTTIAIANGGTGATTKSAAFDALSPMTAQGDMIYGGTSGTGTRLAKGTAGQFLKMNSGETAPEWSSQALAYFTESRWTADPNSSRYVYQLSPAGTGSDNYDVALTPLGTGAFLGNVPDGTAAGGNKRGGYSVDLQLARTLNTQVASGNYALIAGGQNNTAGGDYSAVVGGRDNFAPSYGETALGYFGNSYTPANTTAPDNADRLLSVGNGTSTANRSNALTILKNANTIIGGTLEINRNGNNTSYTFPAGRGADGQFLRTNANGTTNWATPVSGVTAVTGTGPIASSGGTTPVISILPASASAAGSMSAADKAKLDAFTAVRSIGESYGGGIIFWLDASGQHGLIAATSDQSSASGALYYNDNVTVIHNCRGDGLYAGEMNTAVSIARINQAVADVQVYAPVLCADYAVTVDGVTYGDWYLPSKYELNLLYLQKAVVGGFADFYYWSSTEYDAMRFWSQNFQNGATDGAFKGIIPINVRAIRAF